MTIEVLTIGHSRHSFEKLIELLQLHAVNAIADIRSSPYSRFNPDFKSETLKQKLKEKEIKYVFLGRELGARSKDLSCYEQGKVQYRRLAQTELFKAGIERVLKGAKEYRLALLCAEKDPIYCHRMLLVGRELDEVGVSVLHIHDDGRLETQAAAVARLIALAGLSDRSLFLADKERIAEAYARQEKKVAYVIDEQRAERNDGETT